MASHDSRTGQPDDQRVVIQRRITEICREQFDPSTGPLRAEILRREKQELNELLCALDFESAREDLDA